MADRTRRKAAPSHNSARPRAAAPNPQAAAEPPPEPQPQPWETWVRLARRWLPLIGIVFAGLAGAISGLAAALLVLAATALLLAISTLWSSLQLVAGDSSESAHDVVLLAAPGTEYEQKQSVLRALKDLEFERAMGKISDEDYQELRERYRAKARVVLQSLDREIEPVRAEAEKMVTEYLKSRGVDPAPRPEPNTSSSPQASASDSARAIPPAAEAETSRAGDDKTRKCPSCSTRNDPDAAFCKKCGHRVDDTTSTEAGVEP